MNKLKSIEDNIYELCLEIERKTAKLSEKDALSWAKFDSVRHAHTIRAILDYAAKTNKGNLGILNASGLGCGHKDFAIASYLKRNTKININWTTFESPNSDFLSNDLFKKYIKELDISLNLSDFSQSDKLYGEGEALYDIVLFTEIAEHLEHTALLKSLAAVRKKMKDDGILIITTPNLVCLPNRIKFILGNGDYPFFGDGTLNLEKGLYGHINNYDLRRLKRLLSDVGLATTNSYAYTYGYGSREKSFVNKYIVHPIMSLISFFMKDSDQSLFIIANKSEQIKIPLVK